MTFDIIQLLEIKQQILEAKDIISYILEGISRSFQLSSLLSELKELTINSFSSYSEFFQRLLNDISSSLFKVGIYSDLIELHQNKKQAIPNILREKAIDYLRNPNKGDTELNNLLTVLANANCITSKEHTQLKKEILNYHLEQSFGNTPLRSYSQLDMSYINALSNSYKAIDILASLTDSKPLDAGLEKKITNMLEAIFPIPNIEFITKLEIYNEVHSQLQPKTNTDLLSKLNSLIIERLTYSFNYAEQYNKYDGVFNTLFALERSNLSFIEAIKEALQKDGGLNRSYNTMFDQVKNNTLVLNTTQIEIAQSYLKSTTPEQSNFPFQQQATIGVNESCTGCTIL
ncbi:hypothetical protein L3V82_12870 [Thiotrichales bacterium 19S3-7]|nr:hypothetical protein [Thiotrichales bacterium 19S3-7]MCF6803065.1 hypothetical protein [Thiotrichales bacterium 19S3-11]